jgi:hypothetical protein
MQKRPKAKKMNDMPTFGQKGKKGLQFSVGVCRFQSQISRTPFLRHQVLADVQL